MAGQRTRYDGDLDGDGVDDAMVETERVYLIYGDRQEPWMQRSIVNIGKPIKGTAQYALCLGKLSGVPCIVRGFYKIEDGSTLVPYLQLLRLNQEDLTSRADTIRTEVLNEIRAADKSAYGGVILRGEDIWWLYGANRNQETCAKVTLDDGVELKTASRYLGGISTAAYFGHNGSTAESGPMIIDPTRTYITRTYSSYLPEDTTLTSGAVLWRVPDINDPVAEIVAQAHHSDMEPADTENAMLIPDLDGDGKEDMVVGHWFPGSNEDEYIKVVDIFLTSHILPVSVTEHEDVAAPHAVDCAWTGAVARIYNTLGEQVAVLPITHNQLAPSDIEALPMQPLWGVVGDCVKRVR